MKIQRSAKVILAVVALVLAGFVTTAMAADMSLTGSFTGMNKHTTTGQATVVKSGDGWKVVLGDDFSLDGAPDPKVALGNDGVYDPATLHSDNLTSNTGAQEFMLPAGIDGSKYNEVYIWCEKFSVGLGVAKIQ